MGSEDVDGRPAGLMGAIDIARIDGRILVLEGWVLDAAEPAGATFDVRVNGISLPAELQRFARPDLYSLAGDYAAQAGVRLRVEIAGALFNAVKSLEVLAEQASIPINSRVEIEKLGNMAGVVAGKDGYLFLSNDSNHSLDQIAGKMPLTERQAFEIALVHQNRRSFAREQIQADYLHLLVPSKEAVLSHLLPDNIRLQEKGLTPVASYFEAQPDAAQTTFYRPNLLRKLHETQPAFSRTDTHWTHAAALAYLKAGLERHGQGDVAARLDRITLRRDLEPQLGDLGKKINQPPEMVEIIAPANPSARLTMTNGLINEGCCRFYSNPLMPSRERLLFLHASSGQWLLKFIAEIFGEVLAIHCSDFDPFFVTKYKPSSILFCQTERFFVRSPQNNIFFRDLIEQEEVRKGTTNSALIHINKLIDCP